MEPFNSTLQNGPAAELDPSLYTWIGAYSHNAWIYLGR